MIRVLCNSSVVDFGIQYCADAHWYDGIGEDWAVYVDDYTGIAYTLEDSNDLGADYLEDYLY